MLTRICVLQAQHHDWWSERQTYPWTWTCTHIHMYMYMYIYIYIYIYTHVDTHCALQDTYTYTRMLTHICAWQVPHHDWWSERQGEQHTLFLSVIKKIISLSLSEQHMYVFMYGCMYACTYVRLWWGSERQGQHHMCVWLYVCTYACNVCIEERNTSQIHIDVYIHPRRHINIHNLRTYIHAHIHVYTSEHKGICGIRLTHIRIHTYIHTCTHTCIQLRAYRDMRNNAHALIYTYMHTYTHTYTHTAPCI